MKTLLLATLLAATPCASALAQPAERGPSSTGKEGRSLSDELSERKGVIPPKKSGDQEMVRPPKPTGPHATPVIPPPGMRGGPQAK